MQQAVDEHDAEHAEANVGAIWKPFGWP